MTPADLAAIDQEAAALREEIERLTETARSLVAHRGRTQGTADLVAFLAEKFHPVTVAGLAALLLVDRAEGGAA